jgi:hypothetical protein
MADVDLAKISKLPNTAKALSWAAIALAFIGCGLSVSTDFLSHEIASYTPFVSLSLFILAFIFWLLAGREFVDVYHELLFASFKVSLPDSTIEGTINSFANYFAYAPLFYIPLFMGILNIAFYGPTRASEIHSIILPPRSSSVPLQPFVSTLTVAIPVAVSIILGLSRQYSDPILSNPWCVIQLQDALKENLKSNRGWLLAFSIATLFFFALSLTLMSMTLTPKTGVPIILWASFILGVTLGLLAGAIHSLILDITISDVMHLYCSMESLKRELAGQRGQHISAQGTEAR